MRQRVLGVSLTACVIAAVLLIPAAAGGRKGATPTPLASTDDPGEFVPGQVIVRFKAGVAAAARAAALGREGASLERELRLPGAVLVSLPAGRSVATAVAAFARRADVLLAEPNYLHRVAATPNDPRFGELWGLHQANDADIDAPQAWNVTRGSAAVVVAVVDTGVAYGHPDLAGNIWTNPGEIPGNGQDDDANGFVDDVRGWDFVQNDATPLDYHGHGTHVAATIGARGNNEKGVTGVNWRVSLMPLRAGTGNGVLSAAAIADAFAYACDNGAHIVIGAFVATELSTPVRDAVAACPTVLFVFAAGNAGVDLDSTAPGAYPCQLHLPPSRGAGLRNVLCVGATTEGDALASFSSWGAASVHLAAPGRGIVSAVPSYQLLPGFPDGFEGDAGARWGEWIASAGDQFWDRTSAAQTNGSFSLTDSPFGNYADDTATAIRRLSPMNLAGRRGCRIDYDMRLETEFGPDGFLIAAGPSLETSVAVIGWTGSTGGLFFQLSSDLSGFDGHPAVFLWFWFFSNAAVNADGVYLDEVAVKCLVASGEDYDSLDSTSSAAAYAAGVAALLLAQDSTRTVAELKKAILSGVDPLESLAGRTRSGGRLNACKALGLVAQQCDPVPDTVPPETTITSGPTGPTSKPGARFLFTADEFGARFECKLDAERWRPCQSPTTYTALPPGPHGFQVRATDATGNTDPTPATRAWEVVSP